MGSLSDDLDKFLKTDGLRILNGIKEAKAGSYEPLTEEDIDDLDCMNLDGLNTEDLRDLRDKAEELLDNLEDREPPEEDSEVYDLWGDRFSEVEDFIDRVQDRLDEIEEDK